MPGFVGHDAIFQPSKIKHECCECGPNRHEPGAIHCKHCGEPLKIETGGDARPWEVVVGRTGPFVVVFG